MQTAVLPVTLHLLYGLPAGETERYTEELLGSGSPARLDKIEPLAAADGFHSFRRATHTDGVRPDFAKTLN